jgi:hypothetical protein
MEEGLGVAVETAERALAELRARGIGGAQFR